MPEIERKTVQSELKRMIENAVQSGSNRKFEKVRYMKLVMQGMGSGKRYNNLNEALTAHAVSYDELHVSPSNAAMVAGEIKSEYFRGNMENVLINGLARNDSKVLYNFLNERLAELKDAS